MGSLFSATVGLVGMNLAVRGNVRVAEASRTSFGKALQIGYRTGTITGVVRAHAVGGAPVADASVRLYIGYPVNPENTWGTLATGRTDSTGTFRLSYVTRSSLWATTALAGATYIVAVDPPAAAVLGRAIVPGIEVTEKQTTSLGTVVLP